ncbi:MAG: ferritin [Gemmatimonadales bacterium]
MLPKAVQDALNEQIAREFYAAHLYLSMAAYFEATNLPGFAHWMRMQNKEEVEHAMRIFEFVVENGGRVKLKAVAEPPTEFDGPLAVMRKSLEHEQMVTAEIHRIYELAKKEKAYSAELLMHWFVNEQVEEERGVGDIIAQLEMAGESPPTLLMIDRHLASRATTD